MYFHVGQDFLLKTDPIVGIFDLDTAGSSRRTQAFFKRVEEQGAVVDLCGPGVVPHSFILADFPVQTLYLSPYSGRAMAKRAKTNTLEGFAGAAEPLRKDEKGSRT